MKTKLLLLLLCVSAFGYSQTFDNSSGYYINELIASISGTDEPDEYIELRGPVSGVLPAGTYFITVEGDGEDGDVGEVEEILDLSGLSFGSNGYLTITYDNSGAGNSYTTLLAAAASSDYTDVQVTGYDGNLLDYSATYMLISAPAAPSKGDKIDSDPDGELDGISTWNIYDSVSSLDNDGPGTEYGYGQINIATAYTAAPSMFDGPSTSTWLSIDDGSSSTANIYYIARQNSSTGYTINDWMAGQTNSTSVRPNWTFTGDLPRVHPDALASTSLPDSTFGGPNNAVLSVNEVFATNFKIYPNPASDYINIESKSVKVSSVDMYNVLGAKVLSSELTEDRVNVSNLVKGVYFMKINTLDGSLTKKVIID